jgi:hypothetical protein
MRSCNSPVLVNQAAEQATPVHAAWLSLAHGEAGGRRWRRQPKRLARGMPVVVLDLDAQDLRQVPPPDDQQPVQALGPDRANPPLA